MEYFSLPRDKIRPESMLDAMITRNNRRVIWRDFLKVLSGGKTMYAPLIRPKWLNNVLYVASLIAFVGVYIETESFSLSLILAFVFGASFHAITTFLAIEFPKDFNSVKDLTRIVATLDAAVWGRDDVYRRVKVLVAEQLGVREGDIKPNSHFVNDLGMD